MSHSRTERELIVFAKEPVAGQVKTRLAVSIGAERAAGLYALFVREVLNGCSHPDQFWRTVVVVTPDLALQRTPAFIPEGIEVRTQGSGDLGDRLRNAIRESWKQGVHLTVVIGTDCPELTIQDIDQSFSALHDHDTVIGPAKDGGYYLIGINREVKEDRLTSLFQGIAWSTANVFRQTMDRIERAGLRCAVLPERKDIDTFDDLTALLKICSPELKERIEKQLA